MLPRQSPTTTTTVALTRVLPGLCRGQDGNPASLCCLSALRNVSLGGWVGAGAIFLLLGLREAPGVLAHIPGGLSVGEALQP